jgi:subtilisin family serine protease
MGLAIKESVNKQEELFLVKTVDSKRMNQVQNLKSLSSLSEVEFAEPNYIYHIEGFKDDPAVHPNDPSFSNLWAMENTGQVDSTGRAGKVGADIGATKAWALEKGSKDVVVAIVDTGINYNHPDLKDNVWTMPGTTDVHGYNAITGKEDPMDDNSHGSHCAGTIGGVGDNGTGVVGVNWHVSIMAVKFLSASGSGTLADAIKAIDWATDHGAQIMSNSWGGGGFSQALEDAIKRANDKGILFVAAAGNDGGNNDVTPEYPGGYDVPNVIAVAASNNLDVMASFSNYGPTKVHLMAPGENIYSTVLNDGYDTHSGTSMATPHVSGAAALLLAKEPSLTPTEIKERLMRTSDKIKAYRHKLVSGGRLNVYNLLADITPPGPIVIPDTAWKTPISYVIQTSTPYANSAHQSWTLEHPGAKFVRVHFSKFQTEAGYDILTLKNGNGEIVDSLSGNLGTDTWSAEVDGSKLVLEFTSDDSINMDGFKIDSYSWTDYTGKQVTVPASLAR